MAAASIALLYKHATVVADMTEYTPHTTVFGAVQTSRCQARSKRSAEQCRKAAMRGKRVCRTHGGTSKGPKTPEGRQKCAEAKTVHGWETRAIRRERAAKLTELRFLERVMVGAGMIE